jgi:hypothetical protein
MPEPIQFPTAAVSTNVRLDPAVDAALSHVAASLNVTRSSYIEALLRKKFDMGDGQILFKHIVSEGDSVPPELQDFGDSLPQRRTRRGRLPRIQQVSKNRSSNIAVGNSSPVFQSIGKREGKI